MPGTPIAKPSPVFVKLDAEEVVATALADIDAWLETPPSSAA